MPSPKRTEEIRKKAAKTTATTAITRPNLLRFIIMAGYPRGRSGFRAIVYHVAAGDRRRDAPLGRRLDDGELGAARDVLDDGEVGPLAGLQAAGLVPQVHDPGPFERREAQGRRPVEAVQPDGGHRLLEEVHARAAPQSVRAHPDPDAAPHHLGHGRDAAAQVLVGAGAVGRRDTGAGEDLYLLLADARRQVSGDGLGRQDLDPL